MKYGTEANQTSTSDEETIDRINREAKGRSFANFYELEEKEEEPGDDNKESQPSPKPSKNVYVGKREDDLWFSKVDPKLKNESSQTDADVYRILVDNMGIFRWQNPQYVCKICIISIENIMYYD